MREHETGREHEPEEAARRDEEVLGDLDAPELRGGMRDNHDGVELLVHHLPP